MAITDDELRNHLARIYEQLQSQEQRIFDWVNRIRSLEMALRTNESFAELLLAADTALENVEELHEHAAKLAEFDATIRDLRNPPGSKSYLV